MTWSKAYFDILNHVWEWITSVTDRRTDGRTDILLENAALNYIGRPKIVFLSFSRAQMCL